MFLARRRVRARFQTEVMDRSAAYKRLAVVLGVTTAVNAVVGTQLTYRAVEHMETAQFCGSCHVMTPEFKSHENMPHAQITCVQCHVTPGVGGGWSKMAGTRQLMEVVFNTISGRFSALETNRRYRRTRPARSSATGGAAGAVACASSPSSRRTRRTRRRRRC